MGIAYSIFELSGFLSFKARCARVEMPSKPPKLNGAVAGFGQKLFERSEFFWPRRSAVQLWGAAGRLSGRAFFWLLFLARQEK
jgi:hypothetical protein